MSAASCLGITRVFDGIVIRENSVHVLTHFPTEITGDGAHRLALRCLYGEWSNMQPGMVFDLVNGNAKTASVGMVKRTRISNAVPLDRAIRWQPPTDYFLVEANSGSWILKASLFQELAFGADDRYHLFIGGHCFELTLHPGGSGKMKAQILSRLPVGRSAEPSDMTGFTRWAKTDYTSALVRDRFEFAEIKHLTDGEIESSFASGPTIAAGYGADSRSQQLPPAPIHEI